MNTYNLERPLYLLQYEALLRRLPQRYTVYEKIEKDYQKYLSGFQGEESLNYILSFLNIHKEAFICRGLRFKTKDSNYYFQIDLLLVTPSFIYIGEVKNYSGRLTFEPHYGQMLQIKNEAVTTYPCPIQQAKRQATQLAQWLKLYSLPTIPLCAHVIISNPHTQISTHTPIPELYHAELLPEIIDSQQLLHSKRVLTKSQLQELEKLLRKENEEANHSLLKKYNLQPTDVMHAIRCPGCKARRLRRKRETWYCSSCNQKDDHVHLQALQDLAILNVGFHSLSVYRIFLSHVSRVTARKLIFPYVIHNGVPSKGRKYKLELNRFF
ncbi:nuclease-related domain-containing protein [Alkalicoccus daliensis]|uniref:Nuclease-related domain-containing protein n=1 Tax=Alkalicoccus daliensis TaxID=745820 RepID=A0A1H0FBV3_9BACI|nr:nuclease-related domain-containing protein [Alkalicoccus daliensis]SDN92041.1 Nuclease-related domain-containing protein [Alkalicoccus daliensis]